MLYFVLKNGKITAQKVQTIPAAPQPSPGPYSMLALIARSACSYVVFCIKKTKKIMLKKFRQSRPYLVGPPGPHSMLALIARSACS